MSKHFVSIKINAEKGEGPELAQRFAVQGFPTLLVVDPAGDEVDRFSGFRAPVDFIAELKAFVAGKAFGTYKKRLEKNASDFEAALLLGRKYELRQNIAGAKALYQSVIKAEKASADERLGADARISLLTFLESGGTAVEPIRKFFYEHRNTPHVVDHAKVLLREHMTGGDTDKVIEVGDYLVQHDDEQKPMILNAYAWYLATQKSHLPKALTMARQAVELRPDDAYILDTLSEVYFQQKKYAEAVATQEKALEKAPKQQRAELENRLKNFRAALAENS